MNTYKIIYQLSNGYEGEEFIDATNGQMALKLFEELEYFKDVAVIKYILLIEDDEEYNPLKKNLTKLLNLSEQILTVAYDNEDDHLEYLAHELKTTVDFMIEDYEEVM